MYERNNSISSTALTPMWVGIARYGRFTLLGRSGEIIISFIRWEGSLIAKSIKLLYRFMVRMTS